MQYIVSFEMQLNSIELHIIKTKGFSNIYTFKTDSVFNTRELAELHKLITTNNFSGLTDWVKRKYGLAHCRISYSYGPGLRRLLKENKKRSFKNYE